MAAFDGRVHINEVRDEPWRLSADESDGWVQRLLARSAPSEDLTGLSPEAWAERAHLSVSVELSKMSGTDYTLQGTLSGKVAAPCSRCADLFETPRASEFRIFLHRDPRARDDEEGPTEDPDYVIFSSDHIELIDLLSEQLIVLEPFAECPARKPDGACTLCHKNPQFEDNDDTGQSEAAKASSPFLKLAELKKKL